MTETEFLRKGIGRPASRAAAGARALTLACLIIPWLNPYAYGPSTWVIPWLLSAACAAIAYGIQRPGSPRRGVTAALTALAVWTVLRSGWIPETVALVGGCLLVWMLAAAASGQSECPGWVRTAALAWFAAAALSTFAALCQYFGLADALAPWINTSDVGEAFANLRQRNQFASLTGIGMAALLFWLLPGLKRWHAMAAIAWLALGNAVTTSRTGLGCWRCSCWAFWPACGPGRGGNGRGSGLWGCSPTAWPPWSCPGYWRPPRASAQTISGPAWRKRMHVAAGSCCGPTSCT